MKRNLKGTGYEIKSSMVRKKVKKQRTIRSYDKKIIVHKVILNTQTYAF